MIPEISGVATELPKIRTTMKILGDSISKLDGLFPTEQLGIQNAPLKTTSLNSFSTQNIFFEQQNQNSYLMLMEQMRKGQENSYFKPLYDPQFSFPFTNNESLNLFKALYSTKLNFESYIKQVYTQYLDPVDSITRESALDITQGLKTQDQKMEALLSYIIDNVTYKSDLELHGKEEEWAMPDETRANMAGDCEDGAFYFASLALNAGVDAGRIRVYGGFVDDGNGGLGGHAWVSYRRESDQEWVPLDWCYLANKLEVEDKVPLKKDLNYVLPFFFVTTRGTVFYDGIVNTIREPNWPNSMAQQNYRPALKIPAGMMLDKVA
jgi:predicted transglutaminase-like cysteine proteinase